MLLRPLSLFSLLLLSKARNCGCSTPHETTEVNPFNPLLHRPALVNNKKMKMVVPEIDLYDHVQVANRTDTEERLTEEKKIWLENPDVPLAEMVDHLNAHLKDLDDVLMWAYNRCPSGKLIQVTSFGAPGMVILHRMRELGVLGAIPVVSLDTLHLFPETYDFIERVRENFSEMRLNQYRPRGFDRKSAFVETHGQDLWRSNTEEYDHLVKVEPMMRAMDELKPSAWITGRRSSQGNERSELSIFEVDQDDPARLKINPLAHWSYDEVWEYIRKHDIPYNPLHDRGYKSIGDVMTTRPVAEDADERSGRFLGLGGKTECGLHNRPRNRKKKNHKFKRTETV